MDQKHEDGGAGAGPRPAQTEVRKSTRWPPLNGLNDLPLLYVPSDHSDPPKRPQKHDHSARREPKQG